MDNLTGIKKRNKDTLNDIESIDVMNAPSINLNMDEDGASIPKVKNMVQTNENFSCTQRKPEEIIKKEELVLVRNKKEDIQFSHIRYFPNKPGIDFLVRNDEEGIQFSHIRFFPNKPRRDLSKGDFRVNSDNYYNINTFPRGTLTIINVNNFMKSTGLHKYPRSGTNVDAKSLCKLFLDLGFKVDIINNPKSTDVLDILKRTTSQDYSSMSCCVVALLSHGKEGEIFFTNESLNIKKITKFFCTKTLAGKPKVFLIQSCQGEKSMKRLKKINGRKLSNKTNFLELRFESDFLYAFSTVLGYKSFRNPTYGTWFIQSLVSVFRGYAHKMDVVRLLTRVNEELSKEISVTIQREENRKRKQIGSIIFLLRKELFLPPIDEPMESV